MTSQTHPQEVPELVERLDRVLAMDAQTATDREWSDLLAVALDCRETLTKVAHPVEASDEQDQRETVPDLVSRLSDMLGGDTDFDNYTFSIKRGNLRRLLKALQQSRSTPGAVLPMLCRKCMRTMNLVRAETPDVPAWVARIEHDKCDRCDDGDRSAEHWIAADGSEPDPMTGPASSPVPVDAGGGLRAVCEAVVAVSRGGADTVSFLMELNRIAKMAVAALQPAPTTEGEADHAR